MALNHKASLSNKVCMPTSMVITSSKRWTPLLFSSLMTSMVPICAIMAHAEAAYSCWKANQANESMHHSGKKSFTFDPFALSPEISQLMDEMSTSSHTKTISIAQCPKSVRVLCGWCIIDEPCDYTAIAIMYKGLIRRWSMIEETKRDKTNPNLYICMVLGGFY